MARKSNSTILQEELYPQPDESVRPPDEELDDARLLDLDVEQESPFLRGQKRVSARRATLPKKTATHLAWVGVALVLIIIGSAAVSALYHYGEHSWRFRVDSSDDLEIAGLENVTRFQVIEVMGGDIGRNIFFIPLGERQKQLEQIPWVESASVMRFVPNRLKIVIRERTPVAFARVGSKIMLVDADGTLMDLPVLSKKKYSFPVILGMNTAEPHSTRAARMKTYNDVVGQLDSGGGRYSKDLSEVDLSDPDDVKVLANDPGGEVLVHLGSSSYLDRYKVYVSHVREWRQQFAKLDSVDLRYDRQIVVNPDLQGPAAQPPLAPPVAKAAMAAGVKPAALITRQNIGGKSTTVQDIATKSSGTQNAEGKTAKVASARTAEVRPASTKAVGQRTPRRTKAVRPRRKKPILKKASARVKTVPALGRANGPKPAPAPAQSNSRAKAPVSSGGTTTKPSAAPKPVAGAQASNKPSPAIPKGQGQQ